MKITLSWMLRNNLGLMDVTPSLLLQADDRGHCRDKGSLTSCLFNLYVLSQSRGPPTGCSVWDEFWKRYFFFLKIYFTVLGAQQHYLSDRIMKLVEQHFPHLEMKSHSFHGNTLPLLLDPSKESRAQRESFCVARGNYPNQPSWWGFEPEVLYRISPTSKRFEVAVVTGRWGEASRAGDEAQR